MRYDFPSLPPIIELPDFYEASKSLGGKVNTPEIFTKNINLSSAYRAQGMLKSVGPSPVSAVTDSALALADGFDLFSDEIKQADIAKAVGVELAEAFAGQVLDVATDILGDVVAPIAGAIPMIGGFVKAAISLVSLALRQKPKQPPKFDMDTPEPAPDIDKRLAEDYAGVQAFDITSLFMPPRMDTLGFPGRPWAERIMTVRSTPGGWVIGTFSNVGGQTGELGYVPGTGTAGIKSQSGGHLHDTVFVGKNARLVGSTVQGIFDTGDFLPTTRNVALQLWANVNSPSPMIWTVDADRVQQEWFRYIRTFRDYIHGGPDGRTQELRTTLNGEQLRALDAYMAMRFLLNSEARDGKGGSYFTLNLSDERLWEKLIPRRAAERLLQQQAWAQSHKSGLILFADPYDRDWGAFAADGSPTAQAMRADFKSVRSNFVNRNDEAVCRLMSELDDIPAYNREVVRNRGTALGCGSRVRDSTTTTSPGRGDSTNDEGGGYDEETEGFPGGEDQDADTDGNPTGPSLVGNSVGGLGVLVAAGLLGGTLLLGKK